MGESENREDNADFKSGERENRMRYNQDGYTSDVLKIKGRWSESLTLK